ncbi:hypothetical protein CXB51_015231 [Gossypium anomalum]|uniref:F-box domain-containing protein n=1 Tax=Gossypium anomalum TaxID=47600 RepID=A0A8J5YYT3_9ROSI|nr:hypothetical protein CXB51_015231 [Gossypium anomalum]
MEEEQSEFRHWDQLPPDVLGLIFTSLSLQELLTVIPPVCKSWSKAVTDPDEWSCRCQPYQLDRMLRMLVTRSSGPLRNLHRSKFHLLLPFFTIAFMILLDPKPVPIGNPCSIETLM